MSERESLFDVLRHVEFGHGWRRFVFDVGRRRWPTIRGENPPRGVPYLNIEASYGSRCVQVRLWNWRRTQIESDAPVWRDDTTDDDYCEHGYVKADAPHPAAGLEVCPEGCDLG